MNPPDDPGLFTWVLDHWWAPFAGMVAGAWKFNKAAHSETQKVAADALAGHMADDEKKFKAVHEEQQMQRGHIAKLFDKLEENGRRSEERHNELMLRTHTGHIELLQAIHLKADK